RLAGRHGSTLLGGSLRRIAAAKNPLRPEPRRIEQGPEARRLERLRDPGRRQTRSTLDQRLPDGRLHRGRRQRRTAWSHLPANPRRPAERGLVQRDHDHTTSNKKVIEPRFLLPPPMTVGSICGASRTTHSSGEIKAEKLNIDRSFLKGL